MGRTYKADVRRDVTCESCGAGYHYIHAVEVSEGDPDKFDAKIRKAVETGMDLVPCPACGKASAAMWQAFRGEIFKNGLIVAALLTAALLLLLMADTSGLLFYGLIIILSLAALGYVFLLIQILLKPVVNRDKGVPAS